MSKKLSLSISFALIFSVLASCSSGKKKDEYVPPTKANQTLSTWDYDKIRQVRETEDAITPREEIPNAQEIKNCTIMTLAEMRRAKATGCKPLDPRSGNGENSYCCPQTAAESAQE